MRILNLIFSLLIVCTSSFSFANASMCNPLNKQVSKPGLWCNEADKLYSIRVYEEYSLPVPACVDKSKAQGLKTKYVISIFSKKNTREVLAVLTIDGKHVVADRTSKVFLAPELGLKLESCSYERDGVRDGGASVGN